MYKKALKSWRLFHEYWSKQPNVFTVRYEDLFTDPELYLGQILEVMGYQVSQEDIRRAVEKHPPQGGIYKSVHHFREEEFWRDLEQELGPLLTQYGYERS